MQFYLFAECAPHCEQRLDERGELITLANMFPDRMIEAGAVLWRQNDSEHLESSTHLNSSSNTPSRVTPVAIFTTEHHGAGQSPKNPPQAPDGSLMQR